MDVSFSLLTYRSVCLLQFISGRKQSADRPKTSDNLTGSNPPQSAAEKQRQVVRANESKERVVRGEGTSSSVLPSTAKTQERVVCVNENKERVVRGEGTSSGSCALPSAAETEERVVHVNENEERVVRGEGASGSCALTSAADTQERAKERDCRQMHVHTKLRLIEEVDFLQDDIADKRSTVSERVSSKNIRSIG